MNRKMTPTATVSNRRDDYTADDWQSVREEAARAHNRRAAAYLLGMSMVGDFLEEGLAMMGYSCG